MMHQLPQLLKDIRIKKAVYIVKDCSSVFCKVTLKVFSLQEEEEVEQNGGHCKSIVIVNGH